MSEPTQAMRETARTVVTTAGYDWPDHRRNGLVAGVARAIADAAAAEQQVAATLRRNFAEHLVDAYRVDPVAVATLCDERLDRSGALLGYLREAAAKRDRSKAAP